MNDEDSGNCDGQFRRMGTGGHLSACSDLILLNVLRPLFCALTLG